jgi:hypothetical protein
MANETMVRVKLNSARAGHSYDSSGRNIGVFSQSVGDIVEMPASEAQRHVNSGLASLAPLEKKG